MYSKSHIIAVSMATEAVCVCSVPTAPPSLYTSHKEAAQCDNRTDGAQAET